MPVSSQTQRFPAGDGSADSAKKVADCLESLNGDVWATYGHFTSVEHQIKSLNNDKTETTKPTAIPIDELSADWTQCTQAYTRLLWRCRSIARITQKGADAFLKVTRSSKSANANGLGDDTTVLDSAIKTSQEHEQYMRNFVDSVKDLENRFQFFESRWDKLSVHSNRPGLPKLKHCLHGIGTQIRAMCTKLRKIVSPTIHCGDSENVVDSDIKYAQAPITDDKVEAQKLAYTDPQESHAFSNVTEALSSMIIIWLDIRAELQICSKGISKFKERSAAHKNPVQIDFQREQLTSSVNRYARISSDCEKIQEALKLRIPVPAVHG